jgi:hypothetical protein
MTTEGWLVIRDVRGVEGEDAVVQFPAEFWKHPIGQNEEPPISDDEGVLQFHVRLTDREDGYADMEIIND